MKSQVSINYDEIGKARDWHEVTMATSPWGNFGTCPTVFTVEKLTLAISRLQERVGGAKWQNMYRKTLCKGEAQVQATTMAPLQ